MARVELKADQRTAVGGERPRRLRRSGMIPAIMYGGEVGSLPLSVNRCYLEEDVGGINENQILSLVLEGPEQKKSHLVIVKEIQRNHLTDEIIHIDFEEISLHEKLTATVPVVRVGEPAGVRDGGILEQVVREIEIECLPEQLPEKIEVDVSVLAIGDSIQVKDIALPPAVELKSDPDLIVFTVSVPKAEEEAVPAEAEAAAPEVIGGEKEGEEAAAPGEKKEEAAGAKPAPAGAGKPKEAAAGKPASTGAGRPKEAVPGKGKEAPPGRGKESGRSKEGGGKER